MSKLATIIGNLILQILKTVGHLILVAILIAGKVLIGILQFITSWIENTLGSKGH